MLKQARDHLKPGSHIVVAVVWILWLAYNCCRDRPDLYLHHCCNSVVRALETRLKLLHECNHSASFIGNMCTIKSYLVDSMLDHK